MNFNTLWKAEHQNDAVVIREWYAIKHALLTTLSSQLLSPTGNRLLGSYANEEYTAPRWRIFHTRAPDDPQINLKM